MGLVGGMLQVTELMCRPRVTETLFRGIVEQHFTQSVTTLYATIKQRLTYLRGHRIVL